MLHDYQCQKVKRMIGSEIERYGFMLAFRSKEEKKPIGFSLLRSEYPRIAAIHGIASCVGGDFTLTAVSQSRYDANDTFTTSYLQKFTQLMDGTIDSVLEKIASKHILWRFIGFVDGDLSRYQDNDDIWQPLWQKLQPFNCTQQPLNGLPDWASVLLFDGLNHAAVEGQIVLDN
jgi:hypothetical protein